VLAELAEEGVDAPVVVGGIIPEEDRDALLAAGVRAVYTPKDFELARIMDDITGYTEEHRAALSGAAER
jgi:(2R)-ethylmalonyl-CoA mutase